MKRKIYLSVLLVTIAALATQSCGKVISCTNKISAVTTAANEFNADPNNTTKCQTYKQALQDWINDSKCSGADANTKADFETDLAALNC